MVTRAAFPLFLFSTLLVSLALIPLATAQDIDEVANNFQVSYVAGSCGSQETCLFSIDNLTNAHVAECGNFTYMACATRIGAASIKTSCASDEFNILTFSALDGNAHVDALFDPFTYKACAKPVTGYFSCEYATSPSSSLHKCVISVSNQTNAHVSDCTTNPFEYKVYCRAQLAVPAAHTVQIKLKVQSTEDSAYVPGSGLKSSSSIETREYTPTSTYIASQNTRKNLVYAIIAVSGKAQSIGTEKTSGDYTLKLEQAQAGNRMYVVFSKTPLRNLQERAEDLFNGTKIENFGYTLEEVFKILVGLDYGDTIVIDSTDVVQPGGYSLIVRNTNQTSVSEVIDVRVR